MSTPSPTNTTVVESAEPSGPVLGRRGFLRLGALAGGSILLAACGGTSSGSGGGSGGAGGTLRWGWALVTSWDPVTSSAGWDVHALSLVYAGLTKLDEKANPVPALASSWEYDADGTSVTFHLRSGLTFSDGTPLDAAAVKKSLERGRDAENSLVAAQLTTIQEVVAVDAATVRIDLKSVDYQLPAILAGKTGMIVSPKAIDTDEKGLATRPVGAGPFQLTSYVPNDSAKLTRFAGYWDAANIHPDTFELYMPPEAATAVAALQSGRLDVAMIPASQIEAVKAAGFEVQIIPSLVISVLDVNGTVAPFDDPRVVRAIKHAIDRKALVDTVNFGVGDVNFQPFPKGHAGHSDELENAYPFDLARAKKLLAEAGHPDGIDLTLTTAQAEGLPEQVQAQLGKAGIRVKLETIPQAQATQLVYIQRARPFFTDQFAGRESPVQAFQVLFGEQGLMNPGRTTPPALKEAVAKITATPLEDPSYPSVVQAATKIAVETMPNVFLFSNPRILVRRPNVSELGSYLMAQRFEGVTVTGGS
ncbi:peptide/nickel transport system substrate-binding protein [Frankia sp. EI5c]|uniref:ABC transporter substrate-binding protein n=1 Tax=Frankia sp. EI5c TaxID=683316 RepID=UPI0007C2D756|nr:ABC transporter substrate-binding protein [Frankia sp. EI5c]OAA23882.1 peptide/nickel transport system substrate-binding protein [Frankia sp. EI5c]